MRTEEGHEVIARHATRRGYGLAILRNSRSGDYAIVRTHRGAYVTISYHPSLDAARQRANKEWSAEMGR